jgi:hypothetical protein
MEDFVTFDEVGNLPAGIACVHLGEYGIYSVDPPLSKQISGLLANLARPVTRSLSTTENNSGERPEWAIGRQFAQDNSDNYYRLVLYGRLGTVFCSMLGGVLVFAFSTHLFGKCGGLLSLCIWCFEPNIIAHGHLITADLPSSVAALGFIGAFYVFLRFPSMALAFCSGLLLGVAFCCKFTLLFLTLVLILVPILCRTPLVSCGFSKVSGLRGLMYLGLIMLQALIVVNFDYEFQGTLLRLRDFKFVSNLLTGTRADGQPNANSGNRFVDSWLGMAYVPLPRDFVCGIDMQKHSFELAGDIRHNYLNGVWRLGKGWWYYYLYALAIKVPLGCWGLLLLVVSASVTEKNIGFSRLACVLMIAPILIILCVVSSHGSIQSHMRYVLPVFPFLIVLIGRIGQFVAKAGWPRKVIAFCLVVWTVCSSFSVFPCYLSYFNELGGGPNEGYEHLLGSNIDWGQDLWRLKDWLAVHPEASPLKLAYFNSIDPRIIGMDYELPAPGPNVDDVDEFRLKKTGPLPGYYAVSVRLVKGQSAAIPYEHGKIKHVPFGTYRYFNSFRPLAKAGYSIFIYHISLDEANGVREMQNLPLIGNKNDRGAGDGLHP